MGTNPAMALTVHVSIPNEGMYDYMRGAQAWLCGCAQIQAHVRVVTKK